MEEEPLPDHLRCNRSDGRQWRCKRKVMENMKLCEIHYLQGRHRQFKEKVPESLKLQRMRKKKALSNNNNNNSRDQSSVKIRVKKVENLAKLMKRKKKMKENFKRGADAQLELIRMVLKREVEKRKRNKKKKKKKDEEEVVVEENQNSQGGELMRYLPNGLMAISSSPSSSPRQHSGSESPCRVKVGVDFGAVRYRQFRSKNIEPMPTDSVYRPDAAVYYVLEKQEEVKMACPVCRKTCTCKDCIANQSKDTERKNPFNLYVKQVEFNCNEQYCCNKCEASILDLHRNCPNCSFNLCLNCSRDFYHGSFHDSINMSISKNPNKKRSRVFGSKQHSEKKPVRTPKQNFSDKFSDSSALPSDLRPCSDIGGISCPPKEFGGCGESLLNLRCLFPVTWTKELEISAEEIVCSYDFPETSDTSSCCSLCLSTDQKAEDIEQLQEAAVREDSNDNYLYYPKLRDIQCESHEHFQKHWSKGHPVIVRNVLQAAMHLSWDPVTMFCAYLERSIARYENNKDKCDATNCLDWCEVEIGIRQYFMGSLKGQTQTNMWNETLKLKGWMSSQLFQQQFPAHYAEIIHALPFPEYMNPASGLLNLAARLPQEIPIPDLGTADDFVCFLLVFSSQVNILAHTSDVPVSEEQLSKIRKLLKKHNAQNQRESSGITSDEKNVSKVKGKSSLHSGKKEEAGIQDLIGEEMHLRKRVARVSCSSAAILEACSRNLKEDNMLLGGESDSDSEVLLHCGTIRGSESSEDKKNCRVQNQSSNHYGKELLVESRGAQWDVFRRQDVPMLIEYLKRHCNEFAHTHDFHNDVIHPILDQSFFLDTTHKMKLKKEFEIEPWTFEQRVGEAVIIPAGCPYQIRSPKSCVHVVLDFISPENVTECIQLTDEIRQLPEDHKAKVDKLEVKKMALHSINAAIKEIRELTCPM
ncbi:hypothetical protein FEM48_Zijuj01G0142600 [Ziziphus jujuba var. spinosa]|uniref:Lysine-specific demethylase JMJ25 n=1 Tax=Ziziphus jujuba var. spinosa TaxID=714518 RepID=A0A978W1R5_ZIZJJ|nr:hypothetical protein FEM48_Zijuj01G0142600 [Ziziphus jujuba var. spinosa]